jgi:sec-independent protein translocase protein TatC
MNQNQEQSAMPFWDHVGELRKRLTRSGLALIVLMIGGWILREPLFDFLKIPFQQYLDSHQAKLIYTAPAELFFTYFKISIVAALVVGAPFFFYQLWAFIAPGLYPQERKLVWPFVGCSSGLFILGAGFCFTVVLPFTFDFFINLAPDDIEPQIKVADYFSFATGFVLIFGLLFETPLVLVFLGKLGIISAPGMRKYRRYAILGAFVVAALATPSPDAINQILLAMPLWGLYELSIWLIARMEKQQALAEAEKERNLSLP